MTGRVALRSLAWAAAASLAAGNAVIVKPAEATSLCTLRFMEHFRCLPEGLVACITGGAATAQALIRSPGTHAVAFTGSVDAGRQVAAACAEQMKPCVVEAGGNDPMIVMDSAPVEVAGSGPEVGAERRALRARADGIEAERAPDRAAKRLHRGSQVVD